MLLTNSFAPRVLTRRLS